MPFKGFLGEKNAIVDRLVGPRHIIVAGGFQRRQSCFETTF